MKTNVALITGGYTGEAAVSYKSAAFVQAKLDTAKYKVYRIDITMRGWVYQDSDGLLYEIDRRDFSLTIGENPIHFDVALIILHGSPGEDGKLQGYLDMVGVRYTTCDALTSALTMNKGYTKAILQGVENLHLAKSLVLFESQDIGAIDSVRQQLTLPLFVKPNAGGSSIGMSKVTRWEELGQAIQTAFEAENTGRQVLIEEFVDGREFSQGVYRDTQGAIQILPASEVITSRDFFDFEAKYQPGITQEITPAALNDEQRETAKRILKEIYLRLNCKGMVRVDFFIDNQTDRFYFIEINTVPGQTEQSFIPQQVRAAGLTETAFYDEIIQTALQQ